MFPSQRNQLIDLLCDLNNWFLCDENMNGLGIMWNYKTVIPNKTKQKMKKRKALHYIITKKVTK